MLFILFVFLHESRLFLSFFHLPKLRMLLIRESFLPDLSHVPIGLCCCFGCSWEAGIHLVRNCLRFLAEVFANLLKPWLLWLLGCLLFSSLCFLLCFIRFSFRSCLLRLLSSLLFHFFSCLCLCLCLISGLSCLFFFLLLSSLSLPL